MSAKLGSIKGMSRPWVFFAYLAVVIISIAASQFLRQNPRAYAAGDAVCAPLLLILGSLAILDFGSFKTVAQGLKTIFFILLLGTAVELCGVLTGIPFGRYEYGNQFTPIVLLPPTLQRFPVLIGLAWVMIAGAWAVAFSGIQARSLPLAIALAAAASTLTDLLMEPLAMRLGYWRWAQTGPLPGHAPVSNFIGWMVASALVSCIVFANTSSRDQELELRNGRRATYAALIPIVHLVFLAVLASISSGQSPPSPSPVTVESGSSWHSRLCVLSAIDSLHIPSPAFLTGAQLWR